jgi:3-hydroxybutyryl-CoA dehydrogenase
MNSPSQAMPTQQSIIILGDPQLVGEYSARCVERGYHVVHDALATLALELTNLSSERKRDNLLRLESMLPPSVPILSSSVTVSLAEQAAWLKHPSRLAGIGAFPTLLQGSLLECVTTAQTAADVRSAAEAFASTLGKSAVFVEDSVGMVMPRILCMLINEAYFAMMEGVADDAAIDTAMKLGTNYPHGPVEWAQRIGLPHVVAVLNALQRYFGEDRYRCAPLLMKAAQCAGAEG